MQLEKCAFKKKTNLDNSVLYAYISPSSCVLLFNAKISVYRAHILSVVSYAS
jgi:hypothetical protein